MLVERIFVIYSCLHILHTFPKRQGTRTRAHTNTLGVRTKGHSHPKRISNSIIAYTFIRERRPPANKPEPECV